MSQLSDYQRIVERPQKAAYEARIAQLERELADEVTKSTGYYSMWESAASRADIAARDLAEARAEATSYKMDGEQVRLERDAAEAERDNAKSLAEKLICRITELNAERDRLAAEVERKDAALRAMLAHSCVADSAPEDKDEEDHVAERLARAALQSGEKGE